MDGLAGIPCFANGGRVIDSIRAAEKDVERKPSEAQRESGNYAKGHVTVQGLNIAIENPKGSQRSGVDRGGKRWSVTMPATYGYIKGTEGKDGDHVDVYLGPLPDKDTVFVIDQIDAKTGKFDEHKCCIGFATRDDVKAMYRKAFSDGKAEDRMGGVTALSMSEFKAWLKSGQTKKPMWEYLPKL